MSRFGRRSAAQACTAPEEIQRFYERQGGYLALLYVLQATDFHFENLIAAGEHPVLGRYRVRADTAAVPRPWRCADIRRPAGRSLAQITRRCPDP